MYKSVSFNIFDLHLEDIVYKNKTDEKSARKDKNGNRNSKRFTDKPIPKPAGDLWSHASKSNSDT